MAFEDPSIRDIAAQGAAAAGAGLMGRAVAVSRPAQRRISWALLWELPTAVGLGMLGLAVGEHFRLGWWETNGVGFCIAYIGPAAIDEAIQRLRGRARV